MAGATAEATLYRESAERAFEFGNRTDLRIELNYTRDGATVFWREPVDVDSGANQGERKYILHAAAQLWLATGDTAYYAALDSPAAEAAMDRYVRDSRWQPNQKIDLMTYAIAGDDAFPAGWKALCRNKILEQADLFMGFQANNAYRKAWYNPSHGYFTLGAWGTNCWNHIRWFTSAYRVSCDTGCNQAYLDAAHHGVAWMHGANPQGMPYTTGVGSRPLSSVLHLPSQLYSEPAPGLIPFGNIGAIAHTMVTRVFGLFQSSRPNEGYTNPELPQLPPPFNNGSYQSIGEIKELLSDVVPYWRRCGPACLKPIVFCLAPDPTPPRRRPFVHNTCPVAAVPVSFPLAAECGCCRIRTLPGPRSEQN